MSISFIRKQGFAENDVIVLMIVFGSVLIFFPSFVLSSFLKVSKKLNTSLNILAISLGVMLTILGTILFLYGVKPVYWPFIVFGECLYFFGLFFVKKYLHSLNQGC